MIGVLSLLGLLLLPGIVSAAEGTPPQPRLGSAALEEPCILDVAKACGDFCAGKEPAEPCPLKEFGCGFKICNGSLPSPATPGLLTVLEDPAAYARPGLRSPGESATSLSQVRIVDPADYSFKAFSRGLYLVRGQLVQRVPSTAAPEEVRALLLLGGDCARWIKTRLPDRVEDSATSPRVYGVVCMPTINILSIAWLSRLKEADFVGPPETRPAAAPQAAPAAPAAPAAFDAAKTAAAAKELPDDELAWLLERTGFVVIDSGNKILVNGVLPYWVRTTAADRAMVMAKIGEEEQVAVKELYDRLRQRVLDQAGPAPQGQYWVYDDYSGRAALWYEAAKDAPPAAKTPVKPAPPATKQAPPAAQQAPRGGGTKKH